MTPTYSTLLSTLRELVELSKNPDAQPMRLGRAIEAAEGVLKRSEEKQNKEEEMKMSETNKHTPGPWKVQPLGYSLGVFTEMRGKKYLVAQVQETAERLDERERAGHDAKLIAAAPELLEALKAALPILDDRIQLEATAAAFASDSQQKRLAVVESLKAQAASARSAVAKATE